MPESTASTSTVAGYRVLVTDENGLLPTQPPAEFMVADMVGALVKAKCHARRMAKAHPYDLVELYELRAVTVIQEKQIAFVV